MFLTLSPGESRTRWTGEPTPPEEPTPIGELRQGTLWMKTPRFPPLACQPTTMFRLSVTRRTPVVGLAVMTVRLPSVTPSVPTPRRTPLTVVGILLTILARSGPRGSGRIPTARPSRPLTPCLPLTTEPPLPRWKFLSMTRFMSPAVSL